MPYIKASDREQLDPAIEQLADRLATLAREGGETSFAGLLNYACTRLALRVIEARFGRLGYGIIATTTGVFHNIATELYRRMAVPYEEKKIAENGDVPEMERLR